MYFSFSFSLSIPFSGCVMLEYNIEVLTVDLSLSLSRIWYFLYKSLQRSWGAVLRLCGEAISMGAAVQQWCQSSLGPWEECHLLVLVYSCLRSWRCYLLWKMFLTEPLCHLFRKCHLGVWLWRDTGYMSSSWVWEDSLTCLLVPGSWFMPPHPRSQMKSHCEISSCTMVPTGAPRIVSYCAWGRRNHPNMPWALGVITGLTLFGMGI